MGKRHSAGSPVMMAKLMDNRLAGSRHLRRAAEAMQGKSVPAIKKIIRRNRQMQK